MMKTWWRIWGCAGLMLLLVGGGVQHVQTAQTKSFLPPGQMARFAQGQVLVKFKGVTPQPKFGADTEAEFLAVLPTAAQRALAEIQGTVERVFPLIGVLKVGIPPAMPVGRAIESLYRSGTVAYAEPNFEVRALVIPHDDRFDEQWALHNIGGSGCVDADIDAPEAWSIQRSGAKTVVVVIDTGVDYNHQDLAANMWKNPNEIAGNVKDDDNNGYIDDVYGIDVINNDTDPMDDHGHGTHCAGIIGALGNNGIGVCGVNWSAKIMALKFLNNQGGGYVDGAIACMNYALAMKQKNNYPRMVWSNSWGGEGYSQALYDIIKAARDAGVLFVAAAGNDGRDIDVTPTYPAAYDLENIITVGASDSCDKKTSWSNYGGAGVDLFAPGDKILSSLPGNNYDSWSGTSMACPHVAGACALIWSKTANLTRSWQQIKAFIMNGVEDGLARDFIGRSVTEGRLNLRNALQAGLAAVPAIFSATPNIAQNGDRVTLRGINFGTTPGSLKFQETPVTVVSWRDQEIVARITAALPWGKGRMKVTTAAGTSRGAYLWHVGKEAKVGETLIPHGWAARAQVDNNVWIMGGGTYWGMTGLVEKYPLDTLRPVIDGGWIMPQAVTNAGAGVVGTKIYVVGGFSWDTMQALDTLQIFDTLTGTWSSGAALPQKVFQPAVASLGGKIYAFGGLDQNVAVLNTTYVYDPNTNTWSTKANMPTAVTYGTAVRISTDKIWVMGGMSTPYIETAQKVVQQYAPATNAWTTKPSMNKPRGGSGGCVYGLKVFCLKGCGGGVWGQSDSEWFAAGIWRNDILGQEGTYTPAAGILNKKIFTISGLLYRDDYNRYYTKNVWRFTSP